MWSLVMQGEIKPDSKLSGIVMKDEIIANVDDVTQAAGGK
jgi:hypothetical protein